MGLTIIDIVYLAALAVYIIMNINFKITCKLLQLEENREPKKLDIENRDDII